MDFQSGIAKKLKILPGQLIKIRSGPGKNRVNGLPINKAFNFNLNAELFNAIHKIVVRIFEMTIMLLLVIDLLEHVNHNS